VGFRVTLKPGTNPGVEGWISGAEREAELVAGFPFKARPTVIMDATVRRADHF